MCGISGIFNFEKARPVDQDLLKRMTDVLYHRGPDGEGVFCSGNIGLGHRRLSIIDLDSGIQPMFNSDRSITIVLNGEIYNYIELRDELMKLGHKFITTSDTEVVIKAYEQWGIGCQNKFNGMWAFALWDSNKQQLFISRDRIGEKPLMYSLFDNSLVFASEIKSLFEYGVPRIIRPELIEIYLVLTNIPGSDTFYKNIFKLLPGHCLLASSGGIKDIKYWDLPEIDENSMLKDTRRIYEEFSSLLHDSVRIRMRSDVPFGAFLSGGLDSSSIVALMSQISPNSIETFTIGFPQREFDESKLAQLVATKFKTNHHLGSVHQSDLVDSLQRSVFHFDEPFGDSSAIPTYQVSKYAKEHVKMVLTGDGGDEVLSGYNSYKGIKFSSYYCKLPTVVQNTLPTMVSAMSKVFTGKNRYKLNRVASVFESANKPFHEQLSNKRAYTSPKTITDLTKSINGVITFKDYIFDVIQTIPYTDNFYKMMYLNLKYDLPDDYLVKVDRMSMANSIETRAPFLDYRLVEFMVGVDKNIKLQNWQTKSILRNTIGKQLPKEILNAPKKGFGVPLREWVKQDNSNSIYKFPNLKTICDASVIDKVVKENVSGFRDNGNFIWTLLMLENNI